ncbi:hypothetical protein N8482_03060 [Chitinophagales bacterium]|nr:hypothetical protein [Chitinophagales bacterium]
MNKEFDWKVLAVLSVLLVGIGSRIFPHPMNFTPIGALALLGGAYMGRNVLALLVPVMIFWLSDLVLNNTVYAAYNEGFVWFSNSTIWASIAIVTVALMGSKFLQKVSFKGVAAGSIASAVIFFFLTNLGTWLSGMIYPMDLAGLTACFAAGLYPFFLNTLLSNLIFGLILFGLFEYGFQRKVQLARA